MIIESKENRLLCIIFIGLILRLGLLLGAAMQDDADLLHEGDTGTYQALAYAIAKGDFIFGEGQERQMAYIRTPGYPLFLGAGYFLGLDDFNIAFLQILIDGITIYLIFKLGELFGDVGWQAALFYAISPLFISFSFKLVTESFFIFVFVLANFLFFKNLNNRNGLVAVGLLFGFLILIRPVAAPFPIFYALLYYWQKKELLGAINIIIPAYAIAGLWLLRNIVVVNEFSFSRIGILSYACWTGPLIANDEHVDITPWKEEYERFGLRHPDDCTQKIFDNPGPAADVVTKIALAYPLVYMRHTLDAILLLFAPQTPNYIVEILGQERPHLSLILFERGLDIGYIFTEVSKNLLYFALLVLFSAYQVCLYVLCLFGMWKNWKNVKLLAILAIVIIIYIIILQGPQILFSGYRYRMPIEPLLVLGAAHGLAMLNGKKRRGWLYGQK